LPIPSLVISLLLGVPYTDHGFFQAITSTMMNMSTSQQEKANASAQFFGYMMDLVARKEREPGDDLISRLISEHVQTGQLRRETAAMNGIILLNAGHETTANMIALGTVALLENPEALARVRDTDDPDVIANAVAELLRYLTIVHSLVARVAAEDVEIGGQLVKAGEGLIMNLPGGNWDPGFTEQPETRCPSAGEPRDRSQIRRQGRHRHRCRQRARQAARVAACRPRRTGGGQRHRRLDSRSRAPSAQWPVPWYLSFF